MKILKNAKALGFSVKSFLRLSRTEIREILFIIGSFFCLTIHISTNIKQMTKFLGSANLK